MKNEEAVLNEQIRGLDDEETIISGISLLKDDIELLDKQLEILESQEPSVETDIRKEQIRSERKKKEERQNAYLDALLNVLVKCGSQRLSKSKTYKEYVIKKENPKSFATIRGYLLKLVKTYFKYIDDYKINYSKLPFSYYIDNFVNVDQNNKPERGIIYDSTLLDKVEEEIENPAPDESITEKDTVKKLPNLEQQLSVLQESMSPEMFQALTLYFQQFGELDSLNIPQKLDEFPEIIDELKSLAGSETREGVEEFLIQVMEATMEAKNDFVKLKK